MTPLFDIALVATAIIGLTFIAARGLREGWRAVEAYRAECAQLDAADQWDADVTDALRLAAFGRHPISQRRSVAGLWRAMYPRERVHPVLRLITEDK